MFLDKRAVESPIQSNPIILLFGLFLFSVLSMKIDTSDVGLPGLSALLAHDKAEDRGGKPPGMLP